ncbi:beta-1-3, beta-1-6-glucan biosynthesis protein [Tardiphaga sp. 866_E4_N2_1]|uniref:beta-1-3, beta-1-6-glucan biosynthesis protein n=1 Tax=unclassified Tardiphaga TaxID=2631404 RepID=UPI003F23ED83
MRRLVFGFQSAVLRCLAVPGLALLLGVGCALAQSGPVRAQDQKPAANAPVTPADVARESQKKSDEFVEATQAINGPAGNPECVWLGRRVVVLMWRDDLDTAFRHLDLYDRFGCPGGHVQATFRCLVKFGPLIDPKIADSLNSRVHGCWINPNAQPQPAALSQPAAPAPAPAGGGAAAPAATPQPDAKPPAEAPK